MDKDSAPAARPSQAVARPTSKRIGLAVVGAGLASAPHFASLQALASRVEVRWLIGRGPERIGAAAARFPGAKTSVLLGDAIDDPGVDAFLLLVPPATRLELVTRIAESGRHMLLEKPLEADTEGAMGVVRAARDAQVKLAVMLQHRVRPAAIELTRRLQAGELGRVVSASVVVPWWRDQAYYDEPGRGTRARDGGGVLLTQAIHQIDLLIQIVGLPSKVSAFAVTSAAHRMQCEDIAAAALQWSDGAVGYLFATTAAPPGFPERISVSGTRGTALLTSSQLRIVHEDGRVEVFGDADNAAAPGTGAASANPMAFSHEGHLAVLTDFLDAIEADRPPMIDGMSVIKAHRLIDAILASAYSEKVIHVMA